MSELIKFSIAGADELAKKLQTLPPIVARQVIRNSLKPSVEPWRLGMIAQVRRGWHTFATTKVRTRSIRGTFGGRSREYAVIARSIRVGVQIGASGFEGSAAVFPSRRAYWAKFLEFKTRKMRQKFPFVVPAFDAGKNEVLGLFIRDVREQLHKEMNAN